MGAQKLFIFDFSEIFFHTNRWRFTSVILTNDRNPYKLYIFRNARAWEIRWSFSRACLHTLA